jgi:hypothetical protein
VSEALWETMCISDVLDLKRALDPDVISKAIFQSVLFFDVYKQI